MPYFLTVTPPPCNFSCIQSRTSAVRVLFQYLDTVRTSGQVTWRVKLLTPREQLISEYEAIRRYDWIAWWLFERLHCHSINSDWEYSNEMRVGTRTTRPCLLCPRINSLFAARITAPCKSPWVYRHSILIMLPKNRHYCYICLSFARMLFYKHNFKESNESVTKIWRCRPSIEIHIAFQWRILKVKHVVLTADLMTKKISLRDTRTGIY